MPGFGNQDERKSASPVGSAYGAGSGSMYDEDVRNPFGVQNWQGYAPWRSRGGSGGGLPIGGGGSTPGASSFMDPRFAPTATDILPTTQSGWQQWFSNLVSTPGGIGKLASLVPLIGSMRGRSSNPFSSGDEEALLDEIRRGLAIQQQRLEQTQPVFDDLVRRTQAYAPNATYGGPAYAYRGPRFGG